jgi:hypothetical protein
MRTFIRPGLPAPAKSYGKCGPFSTAIDKYLQFQDFHAMTHFSAFSGNGDCALAGRAL